MPTYTENEAGDKWCPMSRVIWLLGSGPGNRTYPTEGRDDTDSKRMHDATMCLGSRCMAWQWENNGVPPVDPKEEMRGRCGMST